MPQRSYDQPDRYTTETYDYTKISGTNPPADSSLDVVSQIRRGGYSGQVTANFHARKRRGDLMPPAAYLRWDASESRPNGSYGGTFLNTSPNPDRKYLYRSTPSRPCRGNSLSKETAFGYINELCKGIDTNALLQAAVAGIKPDLDALTTLAEAHKTVNLVLGARRNFLNLVRQFRKGGYASAKAAADSWLEFRYGWRLLGYDIKNISNYVSNPVRDLILQGQSGASNKREDTYIDPFAGYYCKYDITTRVSRDLSVRATAVARFSVRSANLSLSPITTAWELIPYSFVVDWFISVGHALSAWEVVSAAAEIHCALSFKYKEQTKLSLENVSLGDGEYAESGFASGGSKADCELMLRSPAGRPSFTPQFRNNLSSGRIADAAALLIGTGRAARSIR